MRTAVRNGSDVLSYLFKGLACLVVIIGFFGLIWLRSSVISVEYELGALQEEHWGVLRERMQLMADRAALFSDEEVGTVAVSKLGMEFPDRTKVFYVKRDRGNIPYEASYRR